MNYFATLVFYAISLGCFDLIYDSERYNVVCLDVIDIVLNSCSIKCVLFAGRCLLVCRR